MLNIVFFSNVSENTLRFIQRVTPLLPEEITVHRIPLSMKETIQVHTDHILICPSYGTERNGHVPHQVKQFLTDPDNRSHTIGVIGTGNMNFNKEYAASADSISRKLNIPIMHRMELSGFPKDTTQLLKLVQLTKEDVQQITQQNEYHTV